MFQTKYNKETKNRYLVFNKQQKQKQKLIHLLLVFNDKKVLWIY
jgi:hypothetical protein